MEYYYMLAKFRMISYSIVANGTTFNETQAEKKKKPVLRSKSFSIQNLAKKSRKLDFKSTKDEIITNSPVITTQAITTIITTTSPPKGN